MEHGAAYRQRQNQRVDDSLANSRRSEYRPFRYGINHQTPVSPPASAWSISPVALQQSLPPMVPAEGASDSTDTLPGSTIFESQIAANRPYLENFAWENATEFRPTAVEEPREDAPVASPLSTNGVALEELSTRKYFRDPRFNPEPWMPGFWPRVPWLGLGALLATTALTGASAGLLLASNNSKPQAWRIGNDDTQPHVYISIFETMMNFLMPFALLEGVVIAFWRRLVHGCTLSTLHDMYESYFFLKAMKRAVRLQFNTVAFACTFTVISSVRGPVFQRALTTDESGIQTIYRTDKALVAIGVLFSLAGVIAILPLYVGFWELGRTFSLDPLEIARAFGAPLLEQIDGNATSGVVALERGGMSVRYGAIERCGEEKKLRIDEAKTAIRMPWKGEIFG